MSYERSKAPLALMEQIIMILVFALTAAVCLQAFVYANTLSKKGENENLAASHVQEVVEYCKMSGGDLDQVCASLSGERTESGLKVSYEEDSMTVYLAVTDSSPWLEKARVYAELEDGQEIFSLETAWQKGGQP